MADENSARCINVRLFEWLQVWMVVQRKWMYLEGIFIGGDIRSQLPEEAKKFDAIDKTFKKVSLNPASYFFLYFLPPFLPILPWLLLPCWPCG